MKNINRNFLVLTILTCAVFLLISGEAAQTFGQTCTPPPSGLVAWLPGDGNANDISGNGNNGTLQSGVTYAVGKVAQAFNLDGTANGFIKVNASSSLNVGAGNGLTIEAWIRPTQISTAQILVEWNNNSGASGIGAHLALSSTIGGPSPGNVSANLIDTSGTFHFIESAGGLTTVNAYQHVAVTYDKTTGIANLFLNGAVVATQNLGIFTPQTSYDLYLGKRISDNRFYFGGGLDETSIYNRALAQTEIQAIVNAGSAGKCKPTAPTPVCVAPPSGLAAWLPGDGNARDITGNGNNGIVEGNVTFPAGKVAQAFGLDGTTADVKIPASASLNVGLSNGLTIDAWINPSDLTTAHPIVEWSANSNAFGSVGVHFYASANQTMNGQRNLFANLRDTSGTNHIIYSPINVLNPNVFQHVAVTYDKTSGNASLYVNGAAVQLNGTTSTVLNLGVFTPATTNDLYLGARVSNEFGDGGLRFAGQIDEVEIFNRALAQTEIQAIVNADSAGKCKNAPTAAAVSVSGRVTTASRRGISRAIVSVTDGSGNVLTTTTNSFGYYSFAELAAGDTYIFSVRAKHYQFAQPTQILSINDEQNEVNFTAFLESKLR